MQMPAFSAQSAHPQPLQVWMRAALWTTALMNILGSMTFVPAIPIGREWMGLPPVGHPLYLWIIAEFVFMMGIGYGYCAWRNYAPRIFVAVGAGGKLLFFVTLLAGWLLGDLLLRTPLLAIGDLLFGCLFVVWLLRSSCIRQYGLNQSTFARYETLHFPRAKAIVEASRQIGAIGQSENRIVCAARNTLFRLLPTRLTLRMMDTYFSYDVRKLII